MREYLHVMQIYPEGGFCVSSAQASPGYLNGHTL